MKADAFDAEVLQALQEALSSSRYGKVQLRDVYWHMPEIRPHLNGPEPWRSWKGPTYPPPFHPDRVRASLAHLTRRGIVSVRERGRGLGTLYSTPMP